MMRFDITQPISHQSKTLISFVTKNWRHNFDEAQEDSEECFNRAESTSTKRSRDTARRKRRPKPGIKGAQHPDHHHASARPHRGDR
jgi:hypothetical protein